MSKCDKKTIDANAKRTLELIENLYDRDSNIDIKYEQFDKEREKNINSIMECHDTIMDKIQKDIENKKDGDKHTGADFKNIKTFETMIVNQLDSEVKKYTPIEDDEIKLNNEKSTLVKQIYDIDTKIDYYTKQTDKINADINNNTGRIESSNSEINIMYYGNCIVFGFVILSLFYINFKYLFIKKVTPLTNEKTKSLFSLKNDKKQIEMTLL